MKIKNETKVIVAKAAVGVPVGLAVGSVAWNIALNLAPVPIKLPLKVVRAVGCYGLGMIASHASDKMMDDIFAPLKDQTELKDKLNELQEENKKLKAEREEDFEDEEDAAE